MFTLNFSKTMSAALVAASLIAAPVSAQTVDTLVSQSANEIASTVGNDTEVLEAIATEYADHKITGLKVREIMLAYAYGHELSDHAMKFLKEKSPSDYRDIKVDELSGHFCNEEVFSRYDHQFNHSYVYKIIRDCKKDLDKFIGDNVDFEKPMQTKVYIIQNFNYDPQPIYSLLRNYSSASYRYEEAIDELKVQANLKTLGHEVDQELSDELNEKVRNYQSLRKQMKEKGFL
ncbi:hypothetical protein ACMXYX_18080 (plasmid) [Neptuniibacter sp. QD72_48]|uniref:hypothetical protein n=1 Tax=Neptuniibacter sp. QD72_48 TaxID=3398214 RepID=UPI0039F644C7